MRSKWIRCALLAAWLSVAVTAVAPAAAAPGDLAGWQPSWWQGAVAWLADRLPFVRVTAASEDDEATLPEDDGSTPGVVLFDPDGDENQSGDPNDKNGDGLPDADPDG